MAIYTVSLKYEAWADMTIEASSEEEAREKAWEALEQTEVDTSYGEWTDADVEEVETDEVTCPHCGTVSHIGGLVGPTTDDCPACGKPALGVPA